MAQIVTITNPLTGQPTQVDQLDHTAQQIDDAIARALPSTDYPGCYYRMVDGVTEWVNPPMVFGDEYRTTERFNGKPVYVKSFNFTSWTADTVTSLNVAVTWIVDDTMTWRMGAMKNGVDHPSGIKYWAVPNGEIFDSSIGNNMAVKMFGTDNWGGNKILTVKYTKD